MDAEGDLHLGLENYHHCAHTGVLSDGRYAHATNSISHVLHTKMCLSECCIPRRHGRATSHLCCRFCSVLFLQHADVSELFCCLQMRPKKFSMSRSPLTVVSAVVMNHSPSHRSWVCLPFYKCVYANKHTSSHRPHGVWFIFCFFIHFFVPLCLMLGGKKKLRLLRYLLETISKLPSFTKAAVIAYDLYSAYRTNGFLCGQTVASRLYSVAMTTGCSAICIRI